MGSNWGLERVLSRVSPSTGMEGTRQRVLVCDEERFVVRLIQVNLERAGCSVSACFSGLEAISLLEESVLPGAHMFDAAIIDLGRSEPNGFDVLVWIKSHDQTKNLAVTLVVPPGQEMEWRNKQYRANKYAVKPFNPSEVLP